MRLKKASELLQYSEISINEIAMKVGYDNFSYFSRLCKKCWDVVRKIIEKSKGEIK